MGVATKTQWKKKHWNCTNIINLSIQKALDNPARHGSTIGNDKCTEPNYDIKSGMINDKLWTFHSLIINKIKQVM